MFMLASWLNEFVSLMKVGFERRIAGVLLFLINGTIQRKYIKIQNIVEMYRILYIRWQTQYS